MKMSDMPEVQRLSLTLDCIERIEGWLKNFPERGLSLEANRDLQVIPLDRGVSLRLLHDVRKATLARLVKLGVQA